MEAILIINLKNYPKAFGKGALIFARCAEDVAARFKGVKIALAPPMPDLALVAGSSSISVFSQSVDYGSVGQSTGKIVPEALAASGVRGVIINHSENRVGMSKAKVLLENVKAAGLEACICVENEYEASVAASMNPDYVAIEPRELIGSGVSVSSAKPNIIRDAKKACGKNFSGRLLAGAGISSGADASAALMFGAEGVIVSSVIAKSAEPEKAIYSLAAALELRGTKPVEG
jgi:triosephosphate isomerase